MSKVEELEASEQRMAAIVDLAHQIAAERDSRILLNKVCSAARDMTLAQHAVDRDDHGRQISISTGGDNRYRRSHPEPDGGTGGR